MQSDPRFARYSTITLAVSALAGVIAAVSATLGAPIGAIVLSEQRARLLASSAFSAPDWVLRLRMAGSPTGHPSSSPLLSRPPPALAGAQGAVFYCSSD